jgi:DNA polymerase epsilon subunit 2
LEAVIVAGCDDEGWCGERADESKARQETQPASRLKAGKKHANHAKPRYADNNSTRRVFLHHNHILDPSTMPPPPQPPQKNSLTSFLRRAPVAPGPSSELTSDPFVPLPPSSSIRSAAPRVLAVEIPISILRPIAFRVFTKKHNLTLKSDALALLCQFVGRKCGAEWRDTGAGEKLLDEVARRWKRTEAAGKILVDGGEALKTVLKSLDVPSAASSPALSRSNSNLAAMELGADIPSSMLMGGGTGGDVEMSMADEERDEIEDKVDPREFLKIVDAFEMPKTVYNPGKKMFERYITHSSSP